MPNKTGIEALADIKKMNPAAKVVMCSAMGQEAMVVEAIKLGALDFIDGENGFLFNPLDQEDFVRALEEASVRFVGSGPRGNRMPLSFDDYLKAYMDIDEK